MVGQFTENTQRRTALLLIGGDKTGNEQWYDKFIPIANKLYTEHLMCLEQERIK